MAKIDCAHFNGYKPCGISTNCSDECLHYQTQGLNILIVHLGALGAVLRATSILKPLRRKYPHAKISWVTDAPGHKLLEANPMIDDIYTSNPEDLLRLEANEFDILFSIDKSKKASGIVARVKHEMIFGFSTDNMGRIIPCNQEARELWQLGLDNHKKFFVNKKPETQLMTEALGLDYQRDPYILFLSPDEMDKSFQRRVSWSEHGTKKIIGINTGCSNVLPYKKLTVEKHIELIQAINQNFDVSVVLLGGPEDTNRNHEIAAYTNAIPSPTRRGIRDGLASVGACDIVFTGDSLGMHMAIALRKKTIAWFGSTCAHEIDLYDRGEKILAKVDCAPCWKRSCDKEVMCYDQVSLKAVLQAIARQLGYTGSDKYDILDLS
jgi:heptosyltransferase-2